ncbi:MAG: CoA pyrophosphatase [Deltaproteobacteria bacterium]|nr:CoA pyrophosphatase [Deltaproteobacteria bacterium]
MNSFGKTPDFIDRAIHSLYEKNRHNRIFSKDARNSSTASAVLFLLGMHCKEKDVSNAPCLILNKRSLKVKQPGDLCCPGGSISSRVDTFLSKLLYLPGSPLTRWPYWQLWHKQRRHEAQNMALLFATCLREGFEEMRLNPLWVKLLGPLPQQQLVMFHRVIYPMVCWINHQRQFIPNWEVERVVYIPLQKLLNPSHYARYRLRIETSRGVGENPEVIDYPCFIQKNKDHTDILWGATFRITMVFLEIVFGYKPPDMETLPVVFGFLDRNYLAGNG